MDLSPLWESRWIVECDNESQDSGRKSSQGTQLGAFGDKGINLLAVSSL